MHPWTAFRRSRRAQSALQLVGTLAILALVPGNLWKLLALLVLWALSFPRLSWREAAVFVGGCLFFCAMNVGALRHGVFAFRHPDVLGMPAYELVMWGFYLLHFGRAVRGPVPDEGFKIAAVFAVLFALPFALVTNGALLLPITLTVLLAALLVLSDPFDLAYVGYGVLVGAAIEHVGVATGQWSYPGGGIPLWFATMWGGVGLFYRRLLMPWTGAAACITVRRNARSMHRSGSSS